MPMKEPISTQNVRMASERYTQDYPPDYMPHTETHTRQAHAHAHAHILKGDRSGEEEPRVNDGGLS